MTINLQAQCPCSCCQVTLSKNHACPIHHAPSPPDMRVQNLVSSTLNNLNALSNSHKASNHGPQHCQALGLCSIDKPGVNAACKATTDATSAMQPVLPDATPSSAQTGAAQGQGRDSPTPRPQAHTAGSWACAWPTHCQLCNMCAGFQGPSARP